MGRPARLAPPAIARRRTHFRQGPGHYPGARRSGGDRRNRAQNSGGLKAIGFYPTANLSFYELDTPSGSGIKW
ncbi:hypothetical protein DESC_710066 [Desulfosarcina cetonica]|nr:hypothetical protein DESC_710066 [Desulfosarcina cetonica]